MNDVKLIQITFQFNYVSMLPKCWINSYLKRPWAENKKSKKFNFEFKSASILLIFQQGVYEYEKRFLRLCGGKSEPNISVMYFLRVECIERVGLISQTGRCAAVFSLTKTHTPLSALLLTATKSLSSNLLWGLIAGN